MGVECNIEVFRQVGQRVALWFDQFWSLGEGPSRSLARVPHGEACRQEPSVLVPFLQKREIERASVVANQLSHFVFLSSFRDHPD